MEKKWEQDINGIYWVKEIEDFALLMSAEKEKKNENWKTELNT